MAGGWARDGAVQEQIDASVDDAVKRARNALPRGASLTRCEECDAAIPEGGTADGYPGRTPLHRLSGGPRPGSGQPQRV